MLVAPCSVLKSASLSAHLPYEIIRLVLLESEHTDVLNFARTNKSWWRIICSDNELWKGLYQRRHQPIDVERCWLETFINQLQYTDTNNVSSESFVTFSEEMERKWHNINWKLALEHRIRTEHNWRENLATDIISSDELGLDICCMNLFKNCFIEKTPEDTTFADTSFSWKCFLPVSPDYSGIFIQDRYNHLYVLHASDLRHKKVIEYPCSEQHNHSDALGGRNNRNVIVTYSAKKVIGQYIEASMPKIGWDLDVQDKTCIWTLRRQTPYLILDLPSSSTYYPCNSWIVFQKMTVEDEDESTALDKTLYIQSLFNGACIEFCFDPGSYWTIQSQSAKMLTILLARKDASEESTISCELFKVECTDKSLRIRKCAEGTLAKFEANLQHVNYIYSDCIILVGSLHKDPRVHKVYVVKCSVSKHCTATTVNLREGDTNVLFLETMWKQEFDDYTVFPDLGRLLGCVSGQVWQLFKIDTGEIIGSYTLNISRIVTRVLGPLCVCEMNGKSYLVDVFSGVVLYMLAERSSGLRIVGVAYSIHVTNKRRAQFYIRDYSSFPK
jgi:hypothetical protein